MHSAPRPLSKGWRDLVEDLTDGGLTAPISRLGRRYAGPHDDARARRCPHRSRPRGRARRTPACDPPRSHRRLGAHVRARVRRHARRRPVLVPAQRPVARLPRARRGRARVGRRRQRVRRLPQRLRRDVRRPREPRHRRRRQGQDGRGHPLRGADRGLDHRRRGARAALGPPPLALHELRHRVDDGRDPPRPRGERPRPDRQDRGHLPRPPRRRDGLGQAARRRDGRPRASRLRALRRGLSGGAHRPHARRPVQRRRRARRACSPSSTARSPG